MKKVFLLLSLFISILIFDACVEPNEGCLDPFSSNYDIMADRECEDCCKYPTFTLSTRYLYGEENIDSSIYYQNAADSYFKLRSFYLVLSDFKLTGDKDSYLVRSKVENKDVRDDLLGVRFRNSSNSPGKIIIEDSIRTIDFTVGIPDGLDNPNNYDDDYAVLELLKDSLYLDSIDNKFYKLIVGVEVDSVSKEEVLIGLADLNEEYSSNVTAGTTRGNSLSIQLLIDFERLFSGINFQSDNVVLEANAILDENIGTSIEVN